MKKYIVERKLIGAVSDMESISRWHKISVPVKKRTAKKIIDGMRKLAKELEWPAIYRRRKI